jgi:hypothetical protein
MSDRHETIHYPRRPPLPEREPDQPPPASRRRTVAIVVAAVAASLGAGYVTANVLGDSEQTARNPTATTARTSTTLATTLKRKPAGTLAPSQPAQPPAAAQPAPGTPADPAAPATPPAAQTPPVAPAPPVAPPPGQAASASFDAPIPSGWKEREFAVQHPGYLQSRWDDPRDARTYVIIDWQDGDTGGPAAAAAALRATVVSRSDYREIRFQQTRGKGWIWVYTILDERGRRAARVDLLTRRCGVLFAVLGSTSPKRFTQLQRVFISISEGIRLKERRC